jgi:glucose/arabinose dehydrogenase
MRHKYRVDLSSICRSIALVAGASPGLLCGPAAQGQIATGQFTFELRSVASGLVAPVQLKVPPDNSGRMFIVDQAGMIRILQNGTLLPAPFLDLTSTIVTLNTGYDERGLLGVTFHPQFATNGRFFVRYSRPRTGVLGEPCFGTSRGCHTEVLAEYTVNPPSSNVANPTGTVLFTVDKPQFNHNSGGIAFGPDGFLYFSMGDGGGANDGLADMPPSHGPTGNAQNLGVSMGKVLRFDVSVPGIAIAPPSNPFFTTVGAYQPIYAYGFRNPYDFSFDDFGPGATNALIVADVGQDAFEELDVVTIGGNYGWPIREGLHCFDPFHTTTPPATCPSAGLIDPLFDYPHSVTIAGSPSPIGLAIIGGYVYRGSAFPGAVGKYLFADFSTSFGAADGHLFYTDMSVSPSAAGPQLRPKLGATDRTLGKFVKGMGRDAAGEVYVLVGGTLGPAGATGEVLQIVPCPSDFNRSGTLEVQDIFDFLNAWFSSDPRADFNGGGLGVQDIFDFLNDWFTGC